VQALKGRDTSGYVAHSASRVEAFTNRFSCPLRILSPLHIMMFSVRCLRLIVLAHSIRVEHAGLDME
jgi:hypothetical protein